MKMGNWKFEHVQCVYVDGTWTQALNCIDEDEGFFMRTAMAPGAVSQIVPCNLIPSLSKSEGKRQAVLLKETWLEVLSVSESGDVPQIVARQPVHGIARGCATLRTGVNDIDILVLTSDSGELTLLGFDVKSFLFRQIDSVKIGKPGFAPKTLGQSVVSDPQNGLVAVSAMEDVIQIFRASMDESSPTFTEMESLHLDAVIVSQTFLPGVALVVLTSSRYGNEVHIFPEAEGEVSLVQLLDLGASDLAPNMGEVMAVPGSRGVFSLVYGSKVALFDIGKNLQSGAQTLFTDAPGNFDLLKRFELYDMIDAVNTGECLIVAATWWEYHGPSYSSTPMLVSLENGDLKMITDRIIHLGNFGPCIDVATLVSDYLVMCGDGCDGGVRRMTVDTDFKVNLKLRLVLENFSPVSSFDYDPNEQELFLCSGIGKSGALRRLQLSVPIHTLSRTGSIFVGCNRIWSLKTKISDRHHSFLVISYIDSTTSVLAVDQSGNHLTDNTAEHGLLLQQATIAVGLLIENVPAQVHSEGIRIANLSDKPGVVPKTADWVFPAGTKVNAAVVVEGAIYVAYIAADKGPQITRFELSDGALVESCTQRLKYEVSCMEPFAEKSALVLGTRSPSLEIREVVRLEMLREYPLSNWNLLPQLPQQKDPAILQQLKPTQRTPGIPESVCVHVDEAGPTVVASLRGGMLVTWTIGDGFTLEHKQTKFIDFSSGQLIHARLESSPALILLSERLWLVRFNDGRISCDPTSLKEADAVVPFSLPELGSCLIVISKGALLITKPRRTLICTKKILLRATPRRVLLEQGPDGRKIFIVATYEGGSRHESRIRVFDYETNEQVCASMRIPSSIVNAIISWNGFIVAGLSVEDSRAGWIEPFRGNRTGNFRMKQPGRLMFLKIDRQDPSEERTYPPYVLREMYRQNSLFANTGEVFALAVHAQTGRLLVGMHNVLVICSEDGENAPRLNLGPFFRGKIVSMSFFGETLAVCDEKDSVELFCFAPSTISLVPLFRDVQRRPVASCLMVDDVFVACSDKHGGFFTLHPPEARQQGARSLNVTQSVFSGEFLVGLKRGRLSYVDVNRERDVGESSRGRSILRSGDCIITVGMNGGVFCFVPLEKTDYDALARLEESALDEGWVQPLLGNDHSRYRAGLRQKSSGIIDGDLLNALKWSEILPSTSEGDVQMSGVTPMHGNVRDLATADARNFAEFLIEY